MSSFKSFMIIIFARLLQNMFSMYAQFYVHVHFGNFYELSRLK